MRVIAHADGYAVYGIRTADVGTPPGGYLSAGIHGDEPAGVCALVRWVEKNARLLKRRSWTLMPCLNPWGLVANARCDAHGRDLNRSFHATGIPMVNGWKRFVGERRFLAPTVAMHEDYDGDGIYAYYVGDNVTAARRGIAAASRIIRVSRQPRVDARWRQERGIVRLPVRGRQLRKRPPRGVEGRHILAHHADAVTTLETPSEVAINLRVRAHCAYLDAVVGPLLKLR